jgi:hypothetical protein
VVTGVSRTVDKVLLSLGRGRRKEEGRSSVAMKQEIGREA